MLKAQFQNTKDVKLTVEITMTLEEWEEFKGAIPKNYPFWKISSAITSATIKARETFFEEITEKTP